MSATAGLSWLGLAGCAAFNDAAVDAPHALTRAPLMAPRPRIAPDLIVGSSVGALLGVFWASGLSVAQIDKRSNQGGPLTVFDPSPFADRGWIHGQRLQGDVNTGLGGRRLQELPRRVIVVATRRDDRTPADVVLQPDLGYQASPLRSYFVASRQIGEAAARAELPALRARMARGG